MIHSKHHKYIARLYDQDEFYNLDKDPQELNNVIAVDDYREEMLNHKKS